VAKDRFCHTEKSVHAQYINWLVLFREIISVYFENQQKHVNAVHAQYRGIYCYGR
jgi:hypothetical protein